MWQVGFCPETVSPRVKWRSLRRCNAPLRRRTVSASNSDADGIVRIGEGVECIGLLMSCWSCLFSLPLVRSVCPKFSGFSGDTSGFFVAGNRHRPESAVYGVWRCLTSQLAVLWQYVELAECDRFYRQSHPTRRSCRMTVPKSRGRFRVSFYNDFEDIV
jgi:hypothetical protein